MKVKNLVVLLYETSLNVWDIKKVRERGILVLNQELSRLDEPSEVKRDILRLDLNCKTYRFRAKRPDISKGIKYIHLDFGDIGSVGYIPWTLSSGINILGVYDRTSDEHLEHLGITFSDFYKKY